jgi:hypothetical protein
MGWFDVTLVLLKERQNSKSLLLNLHRKFETINLVIEIDDDVFIVFNDTRDGREKEIAHLNSSMSVDKVLSLLCDWPGLGLLSYRHPKFKFPITLNFHTWADELIDGFTIGFNGHEVLSKEKEKEKEQIIFDIIRFVDYKYAVGDIGNVSDTYINLEQPLSTIIKYIENKKFEMDIRS